MTYHKGDEIAIYGALAWDDPEGENYAIEGFTVKVVLKDNYGNVFRAFSTDDSVVVDGRDNSVALLLTADITNAMEGRYFAIIELWTQGYKIYTNEVETVYIIP